MTADEALRECRRLEEEAAALPLTEQERRLLGAGPELDGREGAAYERAHFAGLAGDARRGALAALARVEALREVRDAVRVVGVYASRSPAAWGRLADATRAALGRARDAIARARAE